MASREDVAEFLLQRGYLLTALEFYQELLEDDGTELDSLKEHFIKQHPNFESESPRYKNRRRAASDADSTLFQHHSNSNFSVNNELGEKLKEKDDRISVLEYELRRAREDISNLRVQLTNIVKKPPLSRHSSFTLSNSPSSEREGDDLHRDKDDMIIQLQRLQRDRIKDHEAKVLNYLIKNYLVLNKYSLTAITFSEEMAEELTTWESVGLDTPEPPPLLSLYRYFFDNEEAGIQGALAKSIHEVSKLKKEISDKDAELRTTKKKALQYQKDNEQLQIKIKELCTTIEDLKTTATPVLPDQKQHESEAKPVVASSSAAIDVQHKPAVANDARALTPTMTGDPSQCPMRATYKTIIRKKRSNAFTLASSREIEPPDETSSRIALEISKIGSLEGTQVVRVVANCLPFIVPGVILSKREELIPVILVAISQHPSSTERFALTKLLFNLIKKPNELQRQVIMNGCIALASLIGPQRTEVELLAQCCDQIGDKHAERRVLVADSCGQLAAYVPAEQKISLILSILQQMVEDKSSLVRAAVARNIALLVASFETDEKYALLTELFIRLLCDADPIVCSVTRLELLPAMVHWSDLIDAFHSKFLAMLLSELQSIIMKYKTEQEVKMMIDPLVACFLCIIPRMKEVLFASNPTITAKEATAYEMQSLATMISFTRMSRSNSLPSSPSSGKKLDASESSANTFSHVSSSSSLATTTLHPSSSTGEGPDLRVLSDKVVAKLKALFDVFISTQPEGSINTKDWPMLDWIINELLPRLLHIIIAVPASHHSIVASLVEIVSLLCRSLGVPFTKKVAKNVFLDEMRGDSERQNDINNKRLLLLPVYLSGVLTSLDEAEIIKYLHELIVNISIEENGWGHHHLPVLKEVVGHLGMQSTFKSSVILDTLCDMVAHPSNQVRLCIVTLFNITIPTSKHAELDNKIVHALITLSNDPDSFVRMECIEPLANIVVNTQSDETLDKLTGTFDKMMQSDSHHIQLAVVHALANIIPHLTFKRQFRDFYILPLLVEQAQNNSTSKNGDNRKKMANALFEAFRAFASASLAKEVIEDQVLPGLKLLMSEYGGIQVEPSFKTMVQSMIQDMKNNSTTTVEKMSTTTPKTSNPNPSHDTSYTNQPASGNDNNSTGSSVAGSSNNQSAEKSTTNTRKNLFEKLDAAASITAASITSSLKVDFDKAIPKWTWKNR